MMSEETGRPRNDLLRRFKLARNAAVPLLAIETPDPAATMSRLGVILNGESPVIQWDQIRGVRPRNEAAIAMLEAMRVDGESVTSPTSFLVMLASGGQNGAGVPAGTVAFMLNAHRFLGSDAADVAQAWGNLRDPFKSNRRMLVALGPEFELPAQLVQDVLVLDEPLPRANELGEIVLRVYTAAKLDAPAQDVIDRCVDALRGLAAFPAEQAAAMSIAKQGMNLEDLWSRKIQQINAMPGLSIWTNKGDTLEKLGGLENAKSFYTRLFDSGRGRPKVIPFIDEIEKAVPSGGQGGVSGSNIEVEALGTLLSHMENTKATGSLLVGVPGAGKSQLVKAIGNYAGCLVIVVDLPGMKGGIVGTSERNLRAALRVIESFSEGAAMWMATSNNIEALPPELRGRFTLPTFFFDLPTKEERDAIWPVYLSEFELDDQERPDDDKWTGREIRACCANAWRLNCSLIEAAEYVVPVAVAAKDTIERLRNAASGCYTSASKPGIYKYRPGMNVDQPKRAEIIN